MYRFVRALEPRAPDACVRVETRPGDTGQVDFGYAGRIHDARDGREKRAWVFVLTLGYSRHQYAELVFDQSVTTWLRCHRHAFERFQGVPARLVVDNAKCAVVKAIFHDPVIQRAYRDCAEQYSSCQVARVGSPAQGSILVGLALAVHRSTNSWLRGSHS
ncbi:MAG: transposase [Gemmatimonadaceae bacterium]|nr:transposase [Gemmatimonadaceae bacterium]